MTTKQYTMKKLHPRNKIKITRVKETQGGAQIAVVEAPLPETFGLTVGSEFTSPFDAATLAGVLQKFKIPAAGGISKRVGVSTTKFYSNPEPTEISFDLEFSAEYSARHEVVEPVIELMKMSLGDTATTTDVNEASDKIRSSLNSVIKGISEATGIDIDQIENSVRVEGEGAARTNSVLGFLGLIVGPQVVTVKFGEVFTISNLWVSSVGVQFSNVVDAEGFPLSATCSVTMIMQTDPVISDINSMFGAV